MKNLINALLSRNGSLILLLLIVAENMLLFHVGQPHIHQGFSAWGLFLSSMAFGIVLLMKFYGKEPETALMPARKQPVVRIGMVLATIAALAFFLAPLKEIFIRIPIDRDISDIIPTIKIACRRFLNHENPYIAPIDFGGYNFRFGYLPLQWMPYCVTEWLGKDARWMSFLIWCTGALVLVIRSSRIENLFVKLCVPLVLLISYWLLYTRNDGIVAMTVETMVAGYYMLLIIGFNQKNAYIAGAVIACCLLSRFIVVLWLPLWFGVLWLAGQRKYLTKAVITIIVLVLVLYVLPFLSADWSVFFKGLKGYDAAAMGEWQHKNDDGLPYHLYRGAGFAYYFFTRLDYLPLLQRIKILQKVHLSGSLLSVAIPFAWYCFHRKKIDHRIFLMGSFKIYLSVFLVLIQVPYEYLMIIGNFVSIAIFAEQARYRLKSKAV